MTPEPAAILNVNPMDRSQYDHVLAASRNPKLTPEEKKQKVDKMIHDAIEEMTE